MYATGIPVGLLVDAKGPIPGVLLGAVSLGIGYFPIYKGLFRHILVEGLFANRSISLRGWPRINGNAFSAILLFRLWPRRLLCVSRCH